VLRSALIILCKKDAKKDPKRHNSEPKKKKNLVSKETKGVATFLGASVHNRFTQYQLPKTPHIKRNTTRKDLIKASLLCKPLVHVFTGWWPLYARTAPPEWAKNSTRLGIKTHRKTDNSNGAKDMRCKVKGCIHNIYNYRKINT